MIHDLDTLEQSCEATINAICDNVKKLDGSAQIFGYEISIREIQIVIVLVIAFCFIRHILANKLFPMLSEILFWDRIRFKEKFGESLFFCLYYSIIWSNSINLAIKEMWFWDTTYYWVPYSAYFPYKFKLIFMIQLAFYISATFMLFTSARKKHSDRWMMMFHHLLTSTLIASSYVVGQWRIGMIVFIFHDIADVFLELAKMMGYIQMYYIQKLVFGLFLMAWFIPRGVLYVWRILMSSLFQSKEYMQTKGDIHMYLAFNLLLVMLWGLNILWSVSIIKFTFKVVQNGESKDYRSDEEEEKACSKKIFSKKENRI